MSKALVLFWLGSQASQAALEPDLAAWERAHWARFEEPVADAPDGLRYDDAAASRAEELIEQARLAASSLDQAGATARLSELDALLDKNPVLPQAAWLKAEGLVVEASVVAPTDPERAAELTRRAEALEGARAPVFGQAAKATAKLDATRVVLRGLGAADEVYWDGNVTRQSLSASVGQHHVRIVRRDRVVWAGWVEVGASTRELRLPAPLAVPCSLDDLEGTRVRRDQVVAPAGVRCSEWAVARPAASGVEVARCRGSSCGVFTHWKKGYGAFYAGPPQPPPGPGFPAWATWTLVGLGTAAATGVVLWQAGAFDEPAPGSTRWTFSGPNR